MGEMSKFWSQVDSADSDSEDVWLLDGLYVLSSSRSYKDENLKQLFACKRKDVVKLYGGIFQWVKVHVYFLREFKECVA